MIAPGLVDRCTLAPAQALDGRQDGPLVDTRYNVPGYGRLYLSWQIVRDSGRLYGMVEAEQYATLEEELAQERESRIELETELADARPILDAMAKAQDRFVSKDRR